MTTTGSKLEVIIQKQSCDDYFSCKQGAFESIVDFKARFTARLEAYKAHGNPERTNKMVAMISSTHLTGIDMVSLPQRWLMTWQRRPSKNPGT